MATTKTTPASTAPGQEMGRKLSVASFYNKAAIQKLVINDQGADHFLVRFVGVAQALKPYKQKEGENAGQIAFGLQGQFEALSVDGETLRGSVLYLPGYINDSITAVFAGDDSVAGVRIGFDIYAKYDETSATSYVFTGRDLINTGAEAVEEVKALLQGLPMPPKMLALEGGK